MKELYEGKYTGERALYGSKELKIKNGVFTDGESPLKESSDIELECCLFGWKYPLWYCKNVRAKDCTWFEMARAGVWYTKDITVENAMIQAPKNFRRCDGLTLKDVTFTNAAETVWSCRNVKMQNVSAAKADYFAMNCENMEIDGLRLDGNYSFDGAKNLHIQNSRLLTKDAFWNSENVVAENCFISGEYLGWNSKNLTLINCTIESLQGMCYIDNLVMKNCRLIDTTLAFEYSTVEADIDSRIESILNPKGGCIKADSIGELIIEKDRVEPEKTVILCEYVDTRKEHPDWIKA